MKFKLILPVLIMLQIVCLVPISAFGQSETRLRGVMIDPNIKSSDIDFLGKNWKVNFIRWQLNWTDSTAKNATPEQYDKWLDNSLKKLDALLPVCEKYRIKVLIDLHSTPGGHNSAGENMFLKDAFHETRFIKTWEKIALRYSSNSTVWGYDLANEPAQLSVPLNSNSWHKIATVTAQAIRRIDGNHFIVVEPLLWGKPDGFKTFSPLPSSISKVIYSFHMYYPKAFTHQNVTKDHVTPYNYPGVIDKKYWDKSQLKTSMQPAIDFQKKHGLKSLLVGEFSAIRWAPQNSAFNYISDLIDIFEENGWDWAYHAFREWQGWSVEYGDKITDTKPADIQTNREKLLKFWFARNGSVSK